MMFKFVLFAFSLWIVSYRICFYGQLWPAHDFGVRLSKKCLNRRYLHDLIAAVNAEKDSILGTVYNICIP